MSHEVRNDHHHLETVLPDRSTGTTRSHLLASTTLALLSNSCTPTSDQPLLHNQRLHFPLSEAQDPICASRQFHIVCCYHRGQTVTLVQVLEQRHHPLSRTLVKVPGRFIGEQKRRVI